MFPTLFFRVEFRGISRQPFDSEPIVVLAQQQLGRPAMRTRSIPNKNDLPWKTTMHLFDEPDQVFCVHVPGQDPEILAQVTTARRYRDGTDDRESVVAVPGTMDRRLTTPAPTCVDAAAAT